MAFKPETTHAWKCRGCEAMVRWAKRGERCPEMSGPPHFLECEDCGAHASADPRATQSCPGTDEK